ncbi:hypothetical protein ElyMa_000996100 [Elysia marginata]|uniref:Uncharacterized protein n=1 Tax=Elysia marginata TaxID=1093978 RepID=A0AAV4HKJ2_9GAST|nr:hypothetical protein ElyMa_000996100 [Elysia marginata]
MCYQVLLLSFPSKLFESSLVSPRYGGEDSRDYANLSVTGENRYGTSTSTTSSSSMWPYKYHLRSNHTTMSNNHLLFRSVPLSRTTKATMIR